MPEDNVKENLKQLVNITEDDWNIFKEGSPGVYKFLSRVQDVSGHRIVAEVIESQYCALGLQVGQRIVIEGGALISEKSTAPLCMRAIGPLTDHVNTIIEMLVSEKDPNERVFRIAECLDPGLDSGGLGKVKFSVRTEPIS